MAHTRELLLFPLSLSLSFSFSACELSGGAPASSRPPMTQPEPAPTPSTPIDPSALPQSAYRADRDGFRVHEWGTLTSVLGSDGVPLPGLHHEEEDLPAFVADRVAQGKADPSKVIDPTFQKMETPVTYFYAPSGRSVTARVDFPPGMLTQWYPYVNGMYPPMTSIQGQPLDRYLQPLDSIPALCQHYYAKLGGGYLDWGQVEVLGPAARPDLPGPLGKSTWGFARNTASNPLRVVNALGEQHEKFLFYRGLGTFELPLHVRFNGSRPVFRYGEAPGARTVGGLFLMVVGPQGAGFTELGTLQEGAELEAGLPEPSLTHAAFVSSLKTRLAGRLVEDGLYTDEAVAMVDTWERSYFLTPGVRLLYLLPQAYTDQIIPLTIRPAPDQLARTMVIRTELLTPSYEQQLSSWLAQLGTGTPAERAAAQAHFLGLGRFAEPHLSRALALAKDPASKQAGEELLGQVRDHRQRWTPQTAE